MARNTKKEITSEISEPTNEIEMENTDMTTDEFGDIENSVTLDEADGIRDTVEFGEIPTPVNDSEEETLSHNLEEMKSELKFLEAHEFPNVPRLGKKIAELREFVAEYEPMLAEFRAATTGVEERRNEWIDSYALTSATREHNGEEIEFATGNDAEYDDIRWAEFLARKAIEEAQKQLDAIVTQKQTYAASQVGIEVDPERISVLDYELDVMFKEYEAGYMALKDSIDAGMIWKPQEFEGKDNIQQYIPKLESHKAKTRGKRSGTKSDSNNPSAGKPRPRLEMLLIKTPNATDWIEVSETVAGKPNTKSFNAMNILLAKKLKASASQDDFLEGMFGAAGLEVNKENTSKLPKEVEFTIIATDKDSTEHEIQVKAFPKQ